MPYLIYNNIDNNTVRLLNTSLQPPGKTSRVSLIYTHSVQPARKTIFLSECVSMVSFGLLFNTLKDLIEPVMTVKIIKRVERMNG